jgi:hypothetical protein
LGNVELPAFVTHYYLPGREPFQNLSDLEGEQLDGVVAELVELRRRGVHHRRFGAKYLAWRRLTEQRLRELFIAHGGEPERTAPHYFVLGESTWFRGLGEGMLSVSLPVAALPPLQASCTLVDSFGAMGFGPQFGFPGTPESHLGRVYRLDELAAVVAEYGLPQDLPPDSYDGYEQRPVNTFVEVQLWSDGPIQHLLPEL